MTECNPDIAFGMEIELPWQVMLRRVDQDAADMLSGQNYNKMSAEDKARMDIGFGLVDDEYKAKIEKVFEDDAIKRGRDAYVEFALEPRRDSNDLLKTVSGLYGQDILREGEQYPLQFTIGNLPPRPSAYYLLLATEICGGTTGQRIREINSWSRRGVGGLWTRHSAELQFGMTTGVEFRSLVLTGQERLNRAMEVANKGGCLVLRALSGEQSSQERWKSIRETMKTAVHQKGVATGMPWWNPQAEPEHWESYAAALDDETWRASLETDILSLLG